MRVRGGSAWFAWCSRNYTPKYMTANQSPNNYVYKPKKIKIVKYLTLLFFLSTCGRQIELADLRYINSSLEEKVVKVVHDSMYHYPNIDEDAILLNINQIDDGYDIRIAEISKESLKWYLIGKKDKIFGFSCYREMPIIVFGNGANNFFSKTKNKTQFDFLETNK